jgi:hypothetical protein
VQNSSVSPFRETGLNRLGKPIHSKKSGGAGLERYKDDVDQATADRFNKLEAHGVDMAVNLAKVAMKVSAPKVHDQNLSSVMQSGLEISGLMIPGIPGAVLKLVSVDDQTVAILSKGQEGKPELLEVESRKQSSLTSHIVSLPDGSDLHLSATSDAESLHLQRSLGKASISTEYQAGEKGYELAGFSFSHSDQGYLASIGGMGLNTEQPATFVSQADGQRSRSARTEQGVSELSSKPLYSDDYQAIESNQATLESLEDAARAVWQDLNGITRRT